MFEGIFIGEDYSMLSDTMAISIVDISQINMEGLVRDVGEEKAMRLLKQVLENNMMLLNLQKQLLKLQVAKDQERRREQKREGRRRENNERWEEKEQRRRKKEGR